MKSLGFTAARIVSWCYGDLAVTRYHDGMLGFTSTDRGNSLKPRCRMWRSCCLARAAMAGSFSGELPSLRAVFGTEDLPVVTATGACLAELVPLLQIS